MVPLLKGPQEVRAQEGYKKEQGGGGEEEADGGGDPAGLQQLQGPELQEDDHEGQPFLLTVPQPSRRYSYRIFCLKGTIQ